MVLALRSVLFESSLLLGNIANGQRMLGVTEPISLGGPSDSEGFNNKVVVDNKEDKATEAKSRVDVNLLCVYPVNRNLAATIASVPQDSKVMVSKVVKTMKPSTEDLAKHVLPKRPNSDPKLLKI
ncbi:hypothetical protein FRX31_009206 [Thalictrum thalictroides]|uniref:Uncharacterized protein n=1 Tax=Thalictrum thalictroides TaxID=46969 RepID=A0A7J6WWB5_THATH|nr:hypothetical protein FRX31_009206 [Thalictrum thalictroides]